MLLLPLIFKKKDRGGGIERTGKFYTDRKRERPNSGQLSEDNQTTFSGFVDFIFPFVRSPRKTG